MDSRTVILYGRSMLLSLLAADLGQSEHLRVMQADSWESVEALVSVHPPDVLFFDLPGAHEGRVLTLIVSNPNLLLVGLDVETNRALLLTGHATGSLTLERVKEIVHGVQPDPEPSRSVNQSNNLERRK